MKIIKNFDRSEPLRNLLYTKIHYLVNKKTQLILTLMIFYLAQIESLESLNTFELPLIRFKQNFNDKNDKSV